MVKDCPDVRNQIKGNIQTQQRGPNSEGPKRNCFYAFKSKGE